MINAKLNIKDTTYTTWATNESWVYPEKHDDGRVGGGPELGGALLPSPSGHVLGRQRVDDSTSGPSLSAQRSLSVSARRPVSSTLQNPKITEEGLAFDGLPFQCTKTAGPAQCPGRLTPLNVRSLAVIPRSVPFDSFSPFALSHFSFHPTTSSQRCHNTVPFFQILS